VLKARAIAEGALGEIIELSARLGRYERLEALLAEVEGRDIGGSAGEDFRAPGKHCG